MPTIRLTVAIRMLSVVGIALEGCGLLRLETRMKVIGSDSSYIDYWHDARIATLQSRWAEFGIRVREGCFSAITKVGTEQPMVVSETFPIPIQPEALPPFISMIVNYHVLHPNSDLIEVLKGEKSFQEAVTT